MQTDDRLPDVVSDAWIVAEEWPILSQVSASIVSVKLYYANYPQSFDALTIGKIAAPPSTLTTSEQTPGD